MAKDTGFSDVDGSASSAALVAYLGRLARLLAEVRREDYAQLRLHPGARVLDVGCGAGEVCVELSALVAPGGTVVGVDPSEAMVDAARRHVAGAGASIDIRAGSIYALPFPDASFDAVRAERVFQHLDDPAAGLREMQRVTRPGGRVMVIDPDHGQTGMALDTPAERAVFDATVRALLRMIANPHSGTRLRADFVAAGLDEVSQVVRALEIGFDDYVPGMFLAERLEAAVAAGELARGEADGFIPLLQARHGQGRFFANAIGYSVVGTRR